MCHLDQLECPISFITEDAEHFVLAFTLKVEKIKTDVIILYASPVVLITNHSLKVLWWITTLHVLYLL